MGYSTRRWGTEQVWDYYSGSAAQQAEGVQLLLEIERFVFTSAFCSLRAQKALVDEQIRLLPLPARQPSPHIRLMLFVEMAKEVTWFDGLSLHPWKIARWVAQNFVG